MSDFFLLHTNNEFLAQMTVLPVAIDIAMLICLISLAFCLFRVILGPALSDRLIALDASGIAVMSLIVLFSLKQGTNVYMSATLVIAVLGFIGMVSMAKYIHQGDITDQSNEYHNAGNAVDGRYDPNRVIKVDSKEILNETAKQFKEVAVNLGKDIKHDLTSKKSKQKETQGGGK